MLKINEKVITAVKAIDDLTNIPENIPKIPSSIYPCKADEYNIWPKLDIITVAPAPNLVIRISYQPKKDKKAPMTVKIDVICPGVSLVLSNIICPMAQTIPENKNAKI